MRLKFALFAAAATLLAGTANAAITVYTTLASFNAAVSAAATDTFENFSISGSTPSPVTRPVGPYGYTAAVSTTTFFGAGTNADHWLSTNTATDSIIFSTFTGGVKGVGGFFFDSDQAGNYKSGDLTVSANDDSGAVPISLTAATTTTFLGFVTTGAFTSITVTATQPTPSFIWPTVNNLILAAAPVGPGVPEPATWAFMIAGFGFTGAAMRRRATVAA